MCEAGQCFCCRQRGVWSSTMECAVCAVMTNTTIKLILSRLYSTAKIINLWEWISSTIPSNFTPDGTDQWKQVGISSFVTVLSSKCRVSVPPPRQRARRRLCASWMSAGEGSSSSSSTTTHREDWQPNRIISRFLQDTTSAVNTLLQLQQAWIHVVLYVSRCLF